MVVASLSQQEKTIGWEVMGFGGGGLKYAHSSVG